MLRRIITFLFFCVGISSGAEVDISSVPYEVSVTFGGNICGGTLIGTNTVLTAAHCAQGATSDGVAVRAGSSFSNAGGFEVNVDQVYIHPEFNKVTGANDLAILKIPETSAMKNVEPIKLIDSENEASSGGIGFVTGWGRKQDNVYDASTDVLQKIPVVYVDSSKCSKMSKNGIDASVPLLCERFKSNTTTVEVCSDASVGSLVSGNVLLGVVSWNMGCASRSSPGIYTYINNYKKWIQTVSPDV